MERVVENTKDSVTCAICTDIFDDARLLSCSHTFCLHCLTEYRADRNDNVKECPICRDLTVPPIGLLYTLPSNEFANKVVEVIRKHDRPEPTAPPIEDELDEEFYVGDYIDEGREGGRDEQNRTGASVGLSILAGVTVGVLTGGLGGVIAGLAVAGIGSASTIEADRRRKIKYTCSGCNMDKHSDTRYMCGMCEGFLLCPTCFDSPLALQLHNAHHIFIKLRSKPKRSLPPGSLLKPKVEQMSQSLDFGSKVHRRAYVHTPERLLKLPAIKCKRCGITPISGRRYKCGMCKDYDLCSDCERYSVSDHNKLHVFLVFRHQAEVNVTSEPLLRAQFF